MSAGKVELLKALVSQRVKVRVAGTEVKGVAGQGQTFPGMKKFPDVLVK